MQTWTPSPPHLYVQIDDWLKTEPRWAPWRPAAGITPELNDAEALTLAVLQAVLGYVSEARWLRFARRQMRHLFPYLPGQPGYNKRLRKLAGTMRRLIRVLAASTSLWTDDVWIVDSTPVECGRSKETARRSDLAGWAEYGYCASHSRYFWGLRPEGGEDLRVPDCIAIGVLRQHDDQPARDAEADAGGPAAGLTEAAGHEARPDQPRAGRVGVAALVEAGEIPGCFEQPQLNRPGGWPGRRGGQRRRRLAAAADPRPGTPEFHAVEEQLVVRQPGRMHARWASRSWTIESEKAGCPPIPMFTRSCPLRSIALAWPGQSGPLHQQSAS
jgi:hypothetical protein